MKMRKWFYYKCTKDESLIIAENPHYKEKVPRYVGSSINTYFKSLTQYPDNTIITDEIKSQLIKMKTPRMTLV